MKTVRQAVRVIAPLALGLLLWRGPTIGGQDMEALRSGARLLWLVLIVVSLLRWPRLWILVPGVLVTRVAAGMGGPHWSDWVEYTAAIQIAVPLILIGLANAVRRLPSPLPEERGRLVPNAEGIGALLAVPVVFVCGAKDWWTALTVLVAVCAGYRAFTYWRTSDLTGRGRGWVVFLIGMGLMIPYCFYWAWPDDTAGWSFARKGGVTVGVLAWVIQRVVAPGRSTSTTG